MEFLKYLLFATLVIIVQAQLVDRSEIQDGGTFTVTCDVNRIGTVPTYVLTILSLSIERVIASGSHSIARYTPFLRTNFTKNIPNDRPWVIEPTGGNGPANDEDNNRATIKLTLYVPDAQCGDAGIYSCNATFSGLTSATASISQNITSNARTDVPKINSDHHNGNDPHFSSNPFGQNITLTCSVMGPKNLVLKWQYQVSDGNLHDYLISNDIKESVPSLVFGTKCDEYDHKSELSFQVQSQETIYVCAVLEGNNQVTETNFTVGIEQAMTAEPNGGPSQAASEANVGAIAGGVIGGLLIAIVISAVYFCCYHKRDNEGSERDEEVEATDTTHAPPSVIYAVPKKVKRGDRNVVTSVDTETLDKPSYKGNSICLNDGDLDDSGESNAVRKCKKYCGPKNVSYMKDLQSEHENHYACADVSSSEDDYDVEKPKPKARSQTLTKDQLENKHALHYAVLVFPQPTEEQPERIRKDEDMPVEYAEIQV